MNDNSKAGRRRAFHTLLYIYQRHTMDGKDTYRYIAILLPDAGNEGIGLGEFENSIAGKLSLYAARLRDERRIKLIFIVTENIKGRYGNDVDYAVMSRREIKALGSRRGCREIIRRLPPLSLIHAAHQGLMIHPAAAPERLVTVHDCNFFHNDISFLHKMKKAWIMRRKLNAATHLAFISHFTKSDVDSRFGTNRPGRVIYNGITDLTAYPGKQPAMPLPENYLFHISRLAEKKNVHLLVEMMRYLPDMNLVLAGSGRQAYEKKLRKTIKRFGLKNVYMTGRVSKEEKARLLGNCQALLFPSKSEGFGLPVVEAMCFGKPVYLSTLTSLPEVGGSEAYYFNDLDPQKMAAVIREKQAEYNLDSKTMSERIKRRAATFDWQKTARLYIDYYLDIIDGKA